MVLKSGTCGLIGGVGITGVVGSFGTGSGVDAGVGTGTGTETGTKTGADARTGATTASGSFFLIFKIPSARGDTSAIFILGIIFFEINKDKTNVTISIHNQAQNA